MRILLISIGFIISIQANAQWTFVGPAGISNGWTLYNNIDIDKETGLPVIVYIDNNKMSCLRFDGIKWDTVGNSSFPNFYVGNIVDFKIDKKNKYNLLFRAEDTNKFSCIEYDGNIWNYVGSQYINDIDDPWPINAFGIDSAGIAYCVSGSYPNHFYVENGDNWKNFSTEGLFSDFVGLPCFDFDKNNQLVLTYIGPGFYSNCSMFVENKWVTVGNNNFNISGFTGISSDVPKLHITQTNDFYLVIGDNETRCFKLNTSNNLWERIGMADLGFGNGDILSDTKSNIYTISNIIQESPYLQEYYVSWLQADGNEWSLLGNSPINDVEVGYLRLAYSEKNNKLYCTYNDFGLSKAVVKEFNLATGTNTISRNEIVRIYPNPAKDHLYLDFVNYSTADSHVLKITNTYGQCVFTARINQQKSYIDLNEWYGKGMFFIQIIDRNNNQIDVKKLIIK